jgi:hypothetical protein
MKNYIKPEVEIISLSANEAVTATVDGSLDLSAFPEDDQP